jgi:hypothetical protein
VAQHWAALLTYRFSDADMTAGDRLTNPLGFQVTRYRRDAETLPESLPADVARSRADPLDRRNGRTGRRAVKRLLPLLLLAACRHAAAQQAPTPASTTRGCRRSPTTRPGRCGWLRSQLDADGDAAARRPHRARSCSDPAAFDVKVANRGRAQHRLVARRRRRDAAGRYHAAPLRIRPRDGRRLAAAYLVRFVDPARAGPAASRRPPR